MCQRKKSFRLINIIIALLLAGVTFAIYSKSFSVGYLPRRPTVAENVFWTPQSDTYSSSRSASRKFHVALTASNSTYCQWQSRIAYHTYKKVKSLGGSDIGQFTRILHASQPDNLVNEIPSFLVSELPDGGDRNYPPLNRPWAFVQWLDLVSIDEEYILMIEPDHVFVKPIPNLAFGDIPVAYKFFYMEPMKVEDLLRRYYPVENGPVTDIYPIGSSPVIIKKHLLQKIASTWLALTMRMEDDPECKNRIGWVLDMYAYATAAALHGVQHIIVKDFMVEPPHDTVMGNAFIIHYTFEMEYTSEGKKVEPGFNGAWRFDKRTYLDEPPPSNFLMPPKGSPETVVALIENVIEASHALPRWDDIGR